MSIIIEQALCGESKKAWDLLGTTMDNLTIAKSLAFKCDLQENTGGVLWQPAIRGFCEGEYFLIIKTFLDTSPEVRKGRVFSHVLIINIDDFIAIENLEQILELLPHTINKKTLIKKIELELKPTLTTKKIGQDFQGRFNKVINCYLNQDHFGKTIVWAGQEDFDSALIEFWKLLTPTERKSFNFGIRFNKDNSPSDKLNLIAVPENVLSKFIGSGYALINRKDRHQPTELIEKFLIGDDDTKRRIENFQLTIESIALSREDISKVSVGIKTFEELENVQDIKKLNTLSHIVAAYSPSPKKGVIYKSKLLQKIASLTESLPETEIHIIRTFKTSSYIDSETILSNALSIWISKNIFSEAGSKKTDVSTFLRITAQKNNDWWSATIEKEFENFLKKINKSKAKIIYNWLEKNPTVLNSFKGHMPDSRDTESSLIAALPTKFVHDGVLLMRQFALAKGWFRLFAKLLLLDHKLEDALSEQLKVDINEAHEDGLKIILQEASSKKILDFAIHHGDPRLIKNTVKLCSKTPSLLEGIQVNNSNWQKIWLEIALLSGKVDKGFRNPKQTVFNFFDLAANGENVNDALLNLIIDSDYANVLDFENREKWWRTLSLTNKEKSLKQTSTYYLENLSKHNYNLKEEDSVLYKYILTVGVKQYLNNYHSNLRKTLPVFESYSDLTDLEVANYLKQFNGQINFADAKRLGELVGKRRYTQSASQIKDKTTKHNNWRFALNECYHLFSILTVGKLYVLGLLEQPHITSEQWWAHLEEIIVEIYDTGNSLKTIWKKAGGKTSDLLMDSTPKTVWKDALDKLRKGDLKEITANDLLKEIHKDYREHKEFSVIYDLRKHFI